MISSAKPLASDSIVTASEDYYFVLGDNRDNAMDSRFKGIIGHHDMSGVLDGVVEKTN